MSGGPEIKPGGRASGRGKSMKIEISKENGQYEVRFDGEIVEVGTTVIREIQLFPGQTAILDVRRDHTQTRTVLELVVVVRAERNGRAESRGNHVKLTGSHMLSKSDVPAAFPIQRWVAELADWARGIPIREEVVIEF